MQNEEKFMWVLTFSGGLQEPNPWVEYEDFGVYYPSLCHFKTIPDSMKMGKGFKILSFIHCLAYHFSSIISSICSSDTNNLNRD